MRYGLDRKEVDSYCSLLVSRLDDRIPRELKGEILYHAAVLYIWGGQLDRAEELIEKWADRLKSRKRDALHEKFLYLLGAIKTLKRDPEGEELRANMREALLEMGRGDVIFDICKSIGDALSEDDPETALLFYLEAYGLSSDLTLDAELMMELTGRLASTAREIGDSEKAIFYALKSLEFARKSESGKDIFGAYMTVAELYRDSGDVGKAIEYLAVALDFTRKQGLKEELGKAAVALAELYFQVGDEGRALKILRENWPGIESLEDEAIKNRAQKMLKSNK